MSTPLLKKMMKGPSCWKGYVAKVKRNLQVEKRIQMEVLRWLTTVLKKVQKNNGF